MLESSLKPLFSYSSYHKKTVFWLSITLYSLFLIHVNRIIYCTLSSFTKIMCSVVYLYYRICHLFFFSCYNNVSQCKCTTIDLAILLLICISLAVWASINKTTIELFHNSFHEPMFSLLLGKYLGIQMKGLRVTVYFTS